MRHRAFMGIRGEPARSAIMYFYRAGFSLELSVATDLSCIVDTCVEPDEMN
jgi:hypothetical protein